MERDRELHLDIAAVEQLIESGALLEAADGARA
jgi:hypothetical protein